MPDPRLLLLAPGDSVYVLRGAIEAGETIALDDGEATLPERLGLGHKIARHAIAAGDPVIKYGAPIGRASRAVRPGEHVHLHNLVSAYTPTYALTGAASEVSS